MCGCTSVETGHTPPHPPPRVQQEGAICAQNQFVQYVEDLKRECKSAFAHSVYLEFSGFRQCSHITVFSSSSSSPTTTTSSSSLSLPPTVKGGEGGWVAPLEEENNYLGHIHTQTLLHTHTHTHTQPHKYTNTTTPKHISTKMSKYQTNPRQIEQELRSTCICCHRFQQPA